MCNPRKRLGWKLIDECVCVATLIRGDVTAQINPFRIELCVGWGLFEWRETNCDACLVPDFISSLEVNGRQIIVNGKIYEFVLDSTVLLDVFLKIYFQHANDHKSHSSDLGHTEQYMVVFLAN